MEDEEGGSSSPLVGAKGLLLGELQEKKYKLTRLEEGTKVRGNDGKLHIERFVDGVLVCVSFVFVFLHSHPPFSTRVDRDDDSHM